jgi:hypothetical protein
MNIRQQIRALWWANLAFTLALYIPLIELYICDIVGFAILLRLHRRLPDDAPEEFASVGWLAAFALAGALAISVLAVATRQQESLNALLFPIALVYFGIGLTLYWHYMGGAAEIAERLQQAELADFIRASRLPFILASIGLLMLVGSLHAAAFPDADDSLRSELMGMGMILPALWCLNAYFLMYPIHHLRQVADSA